MKGDAAGALLRPARPRRRRRAADDTPAFVWPLSGQRCDPVQGYVISKPKPADQLELARHGLPALAVRGAA